MNVIHRRVRLYDSAAVWHESTQEMSSLLPWGLRLSLPMSPYLQTLKMRQSLSWITSAPIHKRERGAPRLDDALTKGKRYAFGRAGVVAASGEQWPVSKVSSAWGNKGTLFELGHEHCRRGWRAQVRYHEVGSFCTGAVIEGWV